MKIFRISYISYISPYLEFQISLPKFKNSLLCLIILPIWKRKSPYLSSGMYHMSDKNPYRHDRRVDSQCLLQHYLLSLHKSLETAFGNIANWPIIGRKRAYHELTR